MTVEHGEIDAALARGELLAAYDAATALLDAGAGSPRIRYLRTLALARMGETAAALHELAAAEAQDRASDEDSLALRGRLLKDLAAKPGADRIDLFGQASEAYLAAHERAGGYFSLINAATLARLARRDAVADRLARRVLTLPEVIDGDSFYALASSAEAALLIGDIARAERALNAALACGDASLGARATTARQLRLLGTHMGHPAIAALVAPPPVAVYSGYMFRPDPAAEAALAARIDAALDRAGIRIAFGAAAAGADILVAEAMIRRGGELNLVLPFAEDDFVATSVVPFGGSWHDRFRAVRDDARSVTYATTTAYIGDPQQFEYGNQIAMGHACLRADHLDTDALLLAVRDAGAGRKRGGTGAMAARWRATGRRVVTVPSGPVDRTPLHDVATAPPAAGRESRSIIFTDFAGYSRLDEQRLPRFLTEVMGRMAAALARRGRDVLFRNTWGDALFAVLASPVAAAEVALSLAESLADVDPAALGLPAGAGMRIGVHHGPVYRAPDPVIGKRGFFGTEVNYAARLEPVTPVGRVYATQPFAALLALAGDRRFRCQYVGPVSLAKAFGTLPMHRLARSDE